MNRPVILDRVLDESIFLHDMVLIVNPTLSLRYSVCINFIGLTSSHLWQCSVCTMHY